MTVVEVISALINLGARVWGHRTATGAGVACLNCRAICSAAVAADRVAVVAHLTYLTFTVSTVCELLDDYKITEVGHGCGNEVAIAGVRQPIRRILN
jgi:hypothetical protein